MEVRELLKPEKITKQQRMRVARLRRIGGRVWRRRVLGGIFALSVWLVMPDGRRGEEDV